MHGTGSLMFSTNRPDIAFLRGEGSWLYDDQDRAYLDFVQGWAVNSLGHSPRNVGKALPGKGYESCHNRKLSSSVRLSICLVSGRVPACPASTSYLSSTGFGLSRTD